MVDLSRHLDFPELDTLPELAEAQKWLEANPDAVRFAQAQDAAGHNPFSQRDDSNILSQYHDQYFASWLQDSAAAPVLPVRGARRPDRLTAQGLQHRLALAYIGSDHAGDLLDHREMDQLPTLCTSGEWRKLNEGQESNADENNSSIPGVVSDLKDEFVKSLGSFRQKRLSLCKGLDEHIRDLNIYFANPHDENKKILNTSRKEVGFWVAEFGMSLDSVGKAFQMRCSRKAYNPDCLTSSLLCRMSPSCCPPGRLRYKDGRRLSPFGVTTKPTTERDGSNYRIHTAARQAHYFPEWEGGNTRHTFRSGWPCCRLERTPSTARVSGAGGGPQQPRQRLWTRARETRQIDS